MDNPRLALLLANYRLHDWLTLLLAGFALLSVLAGCAVSARVRTRFDRVLKMVYFAMSLLMWVITLTVMTVIMIGGLS